MMSVNAKHVVLSYYSGRNHWNHWAKVRVPNDLGLRGLQELFEDRTLFSRSEVIPVLDIRKNYQSRVGEQKELVSEYLFHGVLRNPPTTAQSSTSCILGANARWGLTNEFRHSVSMVKDSPDDGVRMAC